MDYLLQKYMPRIDFDSYEDFRANYKINVPEDFNFGFDVVDAWAQAEPEKRALVWCDESGEEKVFTFTDIMKLSARAANFFRAQGVKKGSVVMLILRRRWEYWICAAALHKLGAVLIPGTLQLTKKDRIPGQRRENTWRRLRKRSLCHFSGGGGPGRDSQPANESTCGGEPGRVAEPGRGNHGVSR